MALPPVSTGFKWLWTLWDLARKVYGLLEAQEKASKAIMALDKDLELLKLEIERLKAREEVLIARAEAAASVAASAVAIHSTADLARRETHGAQSLVAVDSRDMTIGIPPPPPGAQQQRP